MTAPTAADLAAIRARLALLASPSPWRVRKEREVVSAADAWVTDTRSRVDADFIAHAPADISALLAAAEALQARIAELEGQWARLERLLRAGWVASIDSGGCRLVLNTGHGASMGVCFPSLAEALENAPEQP